MYIHTHTHTHNSVAEWASDFETILDILSVEQTSHCTEALGNRALLEEEQGCGTGGGKKTPQKRTGTGDARANSAFLALLLKGQETHISQEPRAHALVLRP